MIESQRRAEELLVRKPNSCVCQQTCLFSTASKWNCCNWVEDHKAEIKKTFKELNWLKSKNGQTRLTCWAAMSDWFIANCWNCFLRLLLWKQIENDLFWLVLTMLPVKHEAIANVKCWNLWQLSVLSGTTRSSLIDSSVQRGSALQTCEIGALVCVHMHHRFCC